MVQSTNTLFKPLLFPTQAGIPYTNTHKHRTSNFKSTLTFQGPVITGSPFLLIGNSCNFFIILRECGSTLYIGLQHVVPPTSTKFELLLLLIQTGISYTNFHRHKTKSTVTFEGPAKCWKSISANRQKWEVVAI